MGSNPTENAELAWPANFTAPVYPAPRQLSGAAAPPPRSGQPATSLLRRAYGAQRASPWARMEIRLFVFPPPHHDPWSRRQSAPSSP